MADSIYRPPVSMLDLLGASKEEDIPLNPFSFIGGLFGNLFEEAQGIAGGVKQLIGAGIHDLGKIGAEIIPGEQAIESDPFLSAAIAKALPGAIWEDLKQRYGPLFRGDFGEFAKQLYNHPLSFGLDVLATGAVARNLALAGRTAEVAGLTARTSGILSKVPFKVIPDSAAEFILGGKASEGYRALYELGTETSAAAYKFGSLAEHRVYPIGMGGGAYPLSMNPFVRTVQKFFLNKITNPPEEMTILEGLPAEQMANVEKMVRAKIAAEGGRWDVSETILKEPPVQLQRKIQVRKLKPWASQLLEKRLAARMFGEHSARFYEQRDIKLFGEGGKPFGLSRGLYRIFEQMPDDVRSSPQALEELTHIIENNNNVLDSLTGVPLYRRHLFDFPQDSELPYLQAIPDTPEGVAETLAPGGLTPRTDIADEVAKLVNDGFEVDFDSDINGNLNSPLMYIKVGDMREAPVIIKKAAESLQGNVVGVLDNFGLYTEGSPMRAVIGYIQTPDGKLIGVAPMTDHAYWANQATRHLHSIIGDIEMSHASLEERMLELEELLTNPDAQAAVEGFDEASALKEYDQLTEGAKRAAENREAAVRMMEALHQGTVRRYLDPNYDWRVRILDDLRVWNYVNVAADELGHGSFDVAAMMRRAFGPFRVGTYMETLADLEEALTDFIRSASLTHGPAGFATKETADVLADFIVDNFKGLDGKPVLSKKEIEDLRILHPGFVESVLDDTGRRTDAIDPRLTAHNIVRRIDKQLWELIAHGDHPGFSWIPMYDTLMSKGLPIPHYMPHYKISEMRPSDYLLKSTDIRSITRREPTYTGLQRRWEAELWRTGRYLKDPFEAYKRLSAEAARHQERLRYIDEITKTFARELTMEEVEEFAQRAHGEILWNPDLLKYRSKARLRFFDDMMKNIINEDMSAEEAIAAAVGEATVKHFEDLYLGTGRLMKVYAIPKHIAQELARRSVFAGGWLTRIFWDAPMNLWRDLVLTSPRWVVQNTIGNIIQTGIRNPKALIYTLEFLVSKRARRLAEALLTEEGMRLVEKGWVKAGIPRPTEFGTAAEMMPRFTGAVKKLRREIGAEAIEGPWKLPAKVYYGGMKIRDFVRYVNSLIEQQFRLGNFVAEYADAAKISHVLDGFFRSHKILRRIAQDGIDTPLFKQVIEEMNKTMGNYMSLTLVERQIVRRFLMPFYGFYKHIAKFVLRMPYETPLKTQLLRWIDETDGDLDREMPLYLRNNAWIGVGGLMPLNPIQETTYINTGGLNPMNMVLLRTGPLPQTNPILKLLLESFMGTSTLTGKEFFGENVVESPTGQRYVVTKDASGAVRVVPIERFTPSLAERVGEIIPYLNFLSGFDIYNQPLDEKIANWFGIPMNRMKVGSYFLNKMRSDVQAYRMALKREALKQAGIQI